MTTSGMSEQFPVQISIGNVIGFAIVFFEKVDDGTQVDDSAQVDDHACSIIVPASMTVL